MILLYRSLIQVAQDFLYCAKTYGKIIIAERFLEKKTIQPASMGGNFFSSNIW